MPEPDPEPVSNWAEAPLDDDMPFESEAESEARTNSSLGPTPRPTTPSRSSSRSRSPPPPPPAPGTSPPAAPRASEPRRRRLPSPIEPRPGPPATPAPNHFLRPPFPGHRSHEPRQPESRPHRASPTGRPAPVAAPPTTPPAAPPRRGSPPPGRRPPPPPPPSDPPAALGYPAAPSATPPFQPSLDEPAEPLVGYELEGDARELFGIDDDDEGWAPPAWVAEAAAKRQSPRGGRTHRSTASGRGGQLSTRLVRLCFDANDPLRLARFWAAALRWEIEDETDEEVGLVSDGRNALQPSCSFPVPEPKAGKNRLHLDLVSESPEHQAEMVERLVALGPGAAGRHRAGRCIMGRAGRSRGQRVLRPDTPLREPACSVRRRGPPALPTRAPGPPGGGGARSRCSRPRLTGCRCTCPRRGPPVGRRRRPRPPRPRW